MKISFDIDCTPQEARAFLGLPDLTPLHDAYLERMKAYVVDGLNPQDFERLARTWMPGIADNLEALRNSFWSAIPGAKPPG
jgi:hypothetical protein